MIVIWFARNFLCYAPLSSCLESILICMYVCMHVYVLPNKLVYIFHHISLFYRNTGNLINTSQIMLSLSKSFIFWITSDSFERLRLKNTIYKTVATDAYINVCAFTILFPFPKIVNYVQLKPLQRTCQLLNTCYFKFTGSLTKNFNLDARNAV